MVLSMIVASGLFNLMVLHMMFLNLMPKCFLYLVVLHMVCQDIFQPCSYVQRQQFHFMLMLKSLYIYIP